MGVRDIGLILRQWEMDARGLHRRLILAPSPGSGSVGNCPTGLRQPRPRLWDGTRTPLAGGPPPSEGRTGGLDVRADRGFPPALGEGQKAELKTAVQEPPAMV